MLITVLKLMSSQKYLGLLFISSIEGVGFVYFCFFPDRDTYIKAMVGESPNDRNDRGTFPPFTFCAVSGIN